MSTGLRNLCRLEWRNFSRSQGQWMYPVMFFVLIIVLFTLGVDPEASRLREMAPAVIWSAYLLSLLLALDHVWRDDYQSGVLEQIVLHAESPLLILMFKVLIRWMLSILPLLLFLPIALSMLQMPLEILLITMSALILGSLVFWLLGVALSALTLNDRRPVLMSLLLLPFAVPIVIFGSRIIKETYLGNETSGMLLLLLGMCVLAISCVPWIVISAIRLNLD